MTADAGLRNASTLPPGSGVVPLSPALVAAVEAMADAEGSSAEGVLRRAAFLYFRNTPALRRDAATTAAFEAVVPYLGGSW